MTGRGSRYTLVPRAKLRPHEEIDAKHADELAERIRSEGALFQPVVADEASLVILDGHHRFAALETLGCTLIPCHLVDYMDPRIQVERWEDGRPMAKTEIVSHALRGELYGIKTSRHRTLQAMPSVATGLARLRPTQGVAT